MGPSVADGRPAAQRENPQSPPGGGRVPGQVLLAFASYGLVCALTHALDGVVWAVFLVGDLSFAAATGVAAYLVVRRRSLGMLT